MGLDMYLRAERYVSSSPIFRPDDPATYEMLEQAFGVEQATSGVDFKSAEVAFTIGYWRKANAIHQWFVDNVQGGTDDCGDYYVDREKLEELRALCLRVLTASEPIKGTVHTGTVYDAEHPQGAVILAEGEIVKDPTVAHELLPTTEGFFFGSTDYDEGYLYDLRETVKIIDRALAMNTDWEFEYHSSW